MGYFLGFGVTRKLASGRFERLANHPVAVYNVTTSTALANLTTDNFGLVPTQSTEVSVGQILRFTASGYSGVTLERTVSATSESASGLNAGIIVEDLFTPDSAETAVIGEIWLEDLTNQNKPVLLGTVAPGETLTKEFPVLATTETRLYLRSRDKRGNYNSSNFTDTETADFIFNAPTSREPVITPTSSSDYFRGDKTFANLANAVRAVLLTGLSTATNATISASDSISAAFGKLQAQLNNIGGRNAANGYLGLNSSGRADAGQIGSGTANNQKFLRGDGTWTDTLPQGKFAVLNSSNQECVVMTTNGANGLIGSTAYALGDPTAGVSSGAVFTLNYSASNFYGFGLGNAVSGKYPIWFQTGNINGGGFDFYKGTSLLMRLHTNGDIANHAAPDAKFDLVNNDDGKNIVRLKKTSAQSAPILDITDSAGDTIVKIDAEGNLEFTDISRGIILRDDANDRWFLYINKGELKIQQL